MSAESPRIPPIPREEWTERSREVFSIVEGEEARKNGSRYNTILILANHPDLALSYLPFSNQLLRKSSLPDRLREIVIIRTAHLCRGAYILHQHKSIGEQAGLSTAEIEALQGSPQSVHWSPLEEAALRAVDELKQNAMISDAIWAVLAKRLDKRQLLEFLFTAGNYIMYSIYLNNSEAQIET